MDEDDYKGFFIVAAVVVVFAAAVYGMVTYRGAAKVEVTQVSWSRAIQIQRYQTVQESGWSVPQGGRETRHYEAIHHWDRYVSGSHQECHMTGTGSQRRNECTTELEYSSRPIYQTKYDYDIDRWVTVRTPEKHGVGHDAVWPDVSDIKEGDALGSERAGMRISKYTVAFTQGYALDITEERWRGFKPGQKAVLVLNIFKQALDVKEVS